MGKVPTNESSLGSIVTDHFIRQLKSEGTITPEIVLTKQGILAMKTITEMINSLTGLMVVKLSPTR